MKHQFSKRDTIIVTVTAVLVVLIILLAQFRFLSPLKAEITDRKQINFN